MQIRTAEMHHIAETGVASHWLYKDADDSFTELKQQTHKWLQSLLELQSASGDSAEFLEHVKVDLFPEEVYVFTPKGKILALPRGATPVDFAYAVHTDIGNRCIACRINYELLPLRTELKNGDQVEIVTAPHANPNPAWLAYVKTGKARSQIRHFLKTMQYDESAALGERLLSHALRQLRVEMSTLDEAVWERFLREIGLKSRQDVLADVGLGKRMAAIVARRLAEGREAGGPAQPKASSAVLIRGTEGIAVQLAQCCRPIPGDQIVGIIKKGQGLVVHTRDCPVIARGRSDRDKWIDAQWELESGRLFEVTIRILAENKRGVLARIAAEIAEAGSNIQNVSMDEEKGVYTTMLFLLQVSNRDHLARIIRNLRMLPDVQRIYRVKGDGRGEERHGRAGV